MPERIALKRLTASDLTFFESLFRRLNVGNQKSINLNADVLVGKLYPTLPSLMPAVGEISVRLSIYGPNAAPADALSRAITKGDAYKNWRLNGEFVRDPEGQAGRYDNMAPGDLAVFEFSGDPTPQRVTLLLISAAAALDARLYKALTGLVPDGRRTMVELSRAVLAEAAAGVDPSHPVWLLAADSEFDAALEDAALSGVGGALKLSKIGKPITAAALAAAKASAEKNGREGEALAWVHLQNLAAKGALASIEWSSQANPVSAYDFFVTVDILKVEKRRIDAKSTSGDFNRPIHMSIAELSAAATGGPYDIYRVYKIDKDGACLRISKDIGPTAKAILSSLNPPQGVVVDCVSIDPKILTWGSELKIVRPDENEGD
jgi:hypothetical protein